MTHTKKKQLRIEAKHSYYIQSADSFVLESIAHCMHEIGVNKRNRRAFRELLNLVQARSTMLAPQEGVSRRHGEADYVRGIANLALRHEHYLRPARDWVGGPGSPHALFASLAGHLTARYAVPGWLNSVWMNRLDARTLMEQELYLRTGAGEPIRNLNPPIPLTRRMEHYLLNAPDDYRFHEAVRFAEARALNCSEAVARAFASSPLNGDFANVEFWRGLIRLFAAHPDELPADQVRPVIDYIYYVKFGRGGHGAGGRPDFSLKGRTPASLLRLKNAWHAELNTRRLEHMRMAQQLAAQTWRRSDIEELRWRENEHASGEWWITEILQGARLAREGRVMQHCVASYQSRCRAGETTIWSMRYVDGLEETPALTIQVHPRTRRIQQARGKYNRLPNPMEWSVLKEWVRQEGLLLGNSV